MRWSQNTHIPYTLCCCALLQVPTALVSRAAAREARQALAITSDSPHPLPTEGVPPQYYHIEGATALEVAFDMQCRIGARNSVIITEGKQQDASVSGSSGSSSSSAVYSRRLLGLTGSLESASAVSTAASLKVADIVVRGPAWEWGDEVMLLMLALCGKQHLINMRTCVYLSTLCEPQCSAYERVLIATLISCTHLTIRDTADCRARKAQSKLSLGCACRQPLSLLVLVV
jgi:hypothetical protein